MAIKRLLFLVWIATVGAIAPGCLKDIFGGTNGGSVVEGDVMAGRVGDPCATVFDCNKELYCGEDAKCTAELPGYYR